MTHTRIHLLFPLPHHTSYTEGKEVRTRYPQEIRVTLSEPSDCSTGATSQHAKPSECDQFEKAMLSRLTAARLKIRTEKRVVGQALFRYLRAAVLRNLSLDWIDGS